MFERPIGIFDSGVGGLTVARAVCRTLPGEDIVYLGDTARVPYGTKSPATVRRYALNTARFLVERGVKALVVACNTASAVALEDLREAFGIPVFGVIAPGAAAAVAAALGAAAARKGTPRGPVRIGVLGTEATVQSGAYQTAIGRLAPEAVVLGQACPLFVPLAEEGWTEGPVPEEVARRYLSGILREDLDALVLGCTHYPLLRATIGRVVEELAGRPLPLVDPGEAAAAILAAELAAGDLLRPGGDGSGRRSFFVTDCPDRLFAVGGRFFGGELDAVEQVDL